MRAGAIAEGIEIAASPEAVFDLLHDYRRRLDWDPFLRRAELEGDAERAGPGVSTFCAARLRAGGMGMRTVYVSFRRPHVAAVRMTAGPWFLADFAASIAQRAVDRGRTRVTYTFRLRARPRWAAAVLEPLLVAVLRRETRRRLAALKRWLESAGVAP